MVKASSPRRRSSATTPRTPRVTACRRCLLYAGMTFYLDPFHLPPGVRDGIRVGRDGVCSACREFARTYRPEDKQRALDLLTLRSVRPGACAIVAVSGGKDSLAALVAARRALGLRVVGLLYDNGFIPADVMRRSQEVCDRLGVELVVKRATPAGATAFRALVKEAAPGTTVPCHACAQALDDAVWTLAQERGMDVVLTGSNYWAAWTDRPYAMSARVGPDGRRLFRVHLPYALGWTRAETRRSLDEAGITIPPMAGVTSNCRVPALVQLRVSAALGHVPEHEDVAMEVMAGHLSREEGLAELREKKALSPALERALVAAGGKAQR